jgi:hypothetical protein
MPFVSNLMKEEDPSAIVNLSHGGEQVSFPFPAGTATNIKSYFEKVVGDFDYITDAKAEINSKRCDSLSEEDKASIMDKGYKAALATLKASFKLWGEYLHDHYEKEHGIIVTHYMEGASFILSGYVYRDNNGQLCDIFTKTQAISGQILKAVKSLKKTSLVLEEIKDLLGTQKDADEMDALVEAMEPYKQINMEICSFSGKALEQFKVLKAASGQVLELGSSVEEEDETGA